MTPDPLTTLSAFLSRWAARQDDPDRAIPIPSADVCAIRLTSAIMETRGVHAGDTLAAFWHHCLAALWHHCARPAMETPYSLDGRLRRVAIITAGPIAAWTIYEDIALGGVDASGYRLIEITAALGAASLTAQTLTRREALAAFVATLPARMPTSDPPIGAGFARIVIHMTAPAPGRTP